MIGRTNKQLKMRVLMVDDDLGSPNSMRGRVLTELVDEFHSRNTELVKATSYEDGLAAVISDAALHCICVDWTLGKNDATTHAQALELLRSIRQRNENVPVFLMADRDAKKSITVEAMELADEFVWMLEDTAPFIVGRVVAAIQRPGTPAAALHRCADPLHPERRAFMGRSGSSGGYRLYQIASGAGVLRLLRREPVPRRQRYRAR